MSDENTEVPTPKKPNRGGRPFPKGKSGNPGGRPKLTEDQRAAKAEAQRILDAATPAAAEAAVAMLKHKDFRARHAASGSVLDRAGLKGVLEVRLLMGREVEKLTERLKAEFGSEPELLLRILAVVLDVDPEAETDDDS